MRPLGESWHTKFVLHYIRFQVFKKVLATSARLPRLAQRVSGHRGGKHVRLLGNCCRRRLGRSYSARRREEEGV